MFDIDLIIPCYGPSELINRGLASIATQWKREYIHVTLVNDCSPNTDDNYQELIDMYKDVIDIRCIKTPENCGQGLARQYGIDNTERDWFMFMDEDDQLGNGLAVSIFVGAVEAYGLHISSDGVIECDDNGEPIRDTDIPEIALVSGPLFEFDDNHTHVIESTNIIWLNSKLYNRKFLKKHNVRFNTPQSRHAEDYYFASCLFFALDNDPDYCEVTLDDDGLYYLWYPNQESQSRVDPHYGYMLSGYTMDGSVNILKYMKSKEANIEWNDRIEFDYVSKILNMTVYSYFTFLSFLEHIKETEYVPKLEEDWYILRDACSKLREMTLEHWETYTYLQKIREVWNTYSMSDVNKVEPWITFETYITKGMDEFSWSYDKLMSTKEYKDV